MYTEIGGFLHQNCTFVSVWLGRCQGELWPHLDAGQYGLSPISSTLLSTDCQINVTYRCLSVTGKNLTCRFCFLYYMVFVSSYSQVTRLHVVDDVKLHNVYCVYKQVRCHTRIKVCRILLLN